MKIDFIGDTNFLIYVLEGKEGVLPFLDFNFGISFISEVELLGYRGITKKEEDNIRTLIDDCFVLEWNSKIKNKTIDLRRIYKIKLPDAIIAATSIVYNFPLVTADEGYSKIIELDLIMLNLNINSI